MSVRRIGVPRRIVVDVTSDSYTFPDVRGVEVVAFTVNGASRSLSGATPTIPNGDDGQVIMLVNVDSSLNVTLHDQSLSVAGSNLRLGAATRVLTPRDTLTLRFVAGSMGDWFEVAFTSGIT